MDIRTQCDNLNEELKQLTKDSKLNEVRAVFIPPGIQRLACLTLSPSLLQRVMTRLEQQRTDMEEDLYMLKRAKQRYVDRVE